MAASHRLTATLPGIHCSPPSEQAFEASMLNCFGLHALHEFLHVPFLAHKRAVLDTSMRLNTEAMGKVQRQLVTAKESTFEDFVAAFEAAKKAEADKKEAIIQAELQRAAESAAKQAALGSAAGIPGASAVLSMGESMGSWLGSAAPQGSYAGSVLSYLGGSLAPLVGGMAGGGRQVRGMLLRSLSICVLCPCGEASVEINLLSLCRDS